MLLDGEWNKVEALPRTQSGELGRRLHFCLFIVARILSTSAMYLSVSFWNCGIRKSAMLVRHLTQHQRGQRNTHLFHFYRVFLDLSLLDARLVVFTELDAGTLCFTLSDRLQIIPSFYGRPGGGSETLKTVGSDVILTD